jgi:hypothetical protein
MLTTQFSSLFYYEESSCEILQSDQSIYVRKQDKENINSIEVRTLPLNTTIWNHILVQYNHSLNTLQCIINGQDVYNWNPTTGGLPNNLNTFLLYIGGWSWNNSNYYAGKIDDIAIWNRALIPEEVTDLYTASKAPSLTTTAATNISLFAAKSGGTITYEGDAPITARGVVWNTSPGPTTTLTTKTSDGTGTGAFTSQLSGLNPNTAYFVRAYATTDKITYYGNEVQFTTLASGVNCDADADCDGIPDATDNCPEYPNPNQTDLNSNGTGDACETGKRFGVNTTTPQSEVHVANGSVFIDNPDKGLILKGSDGKCYKLTVHNGALQLLVVPCPSANQNR